MRVIPNGSKSVLRQLVEGLLHLFFDEGLGKIEALAKILELGSGLEVQVRFLVRSMKTKFARPDEWESSMRGVTVGHAESRTRSVAESLYGSFIDSDRGGEYSQSRDVPDTRVAIWLLEAAVLSRF